MSGFCKGVIAAAIAGLVIAALSHDLSLLRGLPTEPARYPTIIYGTYTTPGTGVAGADFADIYSSAVALRHGESAYRPTTSAFADPLGRAKNYPSAMYWLYVPLSLLPFWPALILHTVSSLLALFGASAFVLWTAGLQRHVGWVLAAEAGLFFLTPIGATHFERGQFDLLVAAMVALCFACIYVERRIFVLAAIVGLAGATKWTSIPFLGCFSAFGFLLASGRRRWAFFTVPWLMLAGTVVFWSGLQEYWTSIRFFDLNAPPFGVTLRYFLPSFPAKALPVATTLALVILVYVRTRSNQDRSQLLIDAGGPLALVLTNFAICYPTTSYEYHTVTALGMLPAIVVWTERASDVPVWLRKVTCALYGTFLVIVFRILDQFLVLSPRAMSAVYLTFSTVFFGICVYIVLARKRAAVTSPGSSGVASEVS